MEKKTLRLSADAILMVRELVQLSLLTGSNIIDHFRAMRFEEADNGYVTVTEAYVTAYNDMVVKMNTEAEKEAEKEAETSIIAPEEKI